MTEEQARKFTNKVNVEIAKIATERRGKLLQFEEILANAIFWLKIVQDRMPETAEFIAVCMANMTLDAMDINTTGKGGETVH